MLALVEFVQELVQQNHFRGTRQEHVKFFFFGLAVL
jgi:hypothetical protein